ncbi:hypothetical protein QQF64_032008 [Cirrhinus molitorella]|uniref:Uncharacterized protein n=1 Tax=Cirrhinus molitorella TaxID=172907 RepID=A0ABR3MYK0_9TELE
MCVTPGVNTTSSESIAAEDYQVKQVSGSVVWSHVEGTQPYPGSLPAGGLQCRERNRGSPLQADCSPWSKHQSSLTCS